MGFGIRVQRMWEINLAGCSGPQKCKVPNRFWTNPGVDPPSRPCAWGFRTRVQGKSNCLEQGLTGIAKYNLASCSGPSEKMHNSRFKHNF